MSFHSGSLRFLALQVCILACHVAYAAPLRLCYEDVPQRPWTLPDGSGLNFELLKRVEAQLGERFQFIAEPWRRCLEEVRTGVMDAVFAAADSPERRVYSVVPTLANGQPDKTFAMYEDKFNVYLRTGSGANWDGQVLRTPNNIVLTQSGYIVARLLRERGFHVDESVKSAEDGLRLLANGSYDAAVLQGPEAVTLIKSDPRFRTAVTQAPSPYEMLPLFLMVSRHTYARDAQRIQKIWLAIKTTRTSSEYQKLEAEAISVR